MYLAARLARLARQWIKERSISCFVKCGVHIFTGSFGSSGSPVDQRTKYKFFWLSVEYIYIAARLAQQWIKELGIIVMRAILV